MTGRLDACARVFVTDGEHRSASNVTIFQQGVFPSPSATYNPELDNQAAGYDTGCRTVQPMPAQSLTYHTETSDSIDDESVSSHFTLPSGTSASMEMLNSTAVSEMYSLHQQVGAFKLVLLCFEERGFSCL